MKPTYEFCNSCKRETQHLNGFCDCYNSSQNSNLKTKIIKVESYESFNTPNEVLNSIKELQNLYIR